MKNTTKTKLTTTNTIIAKIQKLNKRIDKLYEELEDLKRKCKHPHKAIVFKTYYYNDYDFGTTHYGWFKCTVCNHKSFNTDLKREGLQAFFNAQKPIYKEFTGRTLKNLMREVK